MQFSVSWNSLAWCLAAAGVRQHRLRDRGRQLDTKHSPFAWGEAEELEVSETSPELAQEA